MESIIKRTGLVLMGLLLIVSMLAITSSAGAQSVRGNQETATVVDKTCKDIDGFDDNLEGDVSGEWGSIEFTQDDGPLILNVNNGYTVTLCIKKGSANNGNGPIVVGPYVGLKVDEEVNYPGFNPADGMSHYAYIWEKTPESEHQLQVVKEWAGDENELEGLEVVFMLGDVEWRIGDPAISVSYPGVIEPISEAVTGLPENCTYTSDLPDSYTVKEEPLLQTITAINTVECDEDTEVPPTPETPPASPVDPVEIPVTSAAPTTTQQVTVTPVGAVDAGAGANIATSLAGLLGSAGVVAIGAFFRKFSL